MWHRLQRSYSIAFHLASFSAKNGPMQRLLVCVQAVDLDDPLIGFFVSWLEEASRRFSEITVLALRVGRYELPKNVHVIPFRAAGSRSRFAVIKTLLKESWLRRGAYDAVFVRGDPQYVLLAGWLWRLLGKRIVFWYAHWQVSSWAALANRVAHVTVSSVRAAFSHPTITPLFIGQNVDHTRFSAPAAPNEGKPRCLAFGSLRPIKRVDVSIQAFLAAGGEEVGASLTVIGPNTDPGYEQTLHALADGHPAIQWGPAASYDQVPDVLASYDILLNACAGSLDKVVIEAMMSGQVVIAATPGIKEWLPEELHWLYAVSVEEMSQALKRVFALLPEERWKLGLRLRELAIQFHSLQGQVERIAELAEQR